jgi:hypothetical protein
MKRWGLALFAQGLAWIISILILESADPSLHVSVIEALLAGIFAALFSALFKEPIWRMPMQLGFSILVGLGLHIQTLPNYVWLIALSIASLLFGGGITGKRAPLYLTQQRAFEAILSCIPEHLEGKCLDVGAGIGSFMLSVAPHRPQMLFEGVERAPLTCVVGNLRCKWFRAGSIKWGDLWKISLHDYQVVYAFLSPEAMEALWLKAKKEMQPGALLIVNAFEIPKIKADRVIRYGQGMSDQILCYRLPKP